jgi:hypothetical protein
MTTNGPLTSTNKTDFHTIYSRPDPRAYFGVLAPLGYQIPQRALPVIETVLAASGARTMLDVCCSYGINAALLRHDLDLDQIAARATDPRYHHPQLGGFAEAGGDPGERAGSDVADAAGAHDQLDLGQPRCELG